MTSHSSGYKPSSGKFLYYWCFNWQSLMMQHKVITSATLGKPIHDIINYSAFICPFEFEKCRMEGNKLQKFEYLNNEKSIFQFLKGYQLMKI